MFPIPLILSAAVFAVAADDLRFANPVVDLGEIKGQMRQTHRFAFTVHGYGPLDIVDVERSCGCLAPRLARKRYFPGESGVLMIETRATAQADGPHTWFAKVRYIAGGKLKAAELRINVRVRNDVTLKPPQVAYVGPGPFRQEIVLSDSRDRPLQVTGLQSTVPFLKATVASREAGRTRILLEAPAGIAPDRYDARLIVQTSDPDYEILEAPVTLKIEKLSAISVLPERITLETAGTQPTSMIVRLHTSGSEKILVDKITPGHEGLSCTWASGPGPDVTLRVRLDPARLDGVLQSSLRIVLTRPAEVLVIPVQFDIKK